MSAENIRFFKYVFLDVVGYSKRNAGAQARISAAQDRMILTALAEHSISEAERILRPLGDGVCIALLTAVENYDLHVRVALSILHLLSDHNEKVDDKERFQVRVGIHQNTDNLVTDINGDFNVTGEGINLAQRIMSLADTNQILVSDVVHEELHKKEKYEGKLRQLPVKNVKHDEPVQVSQYIDEAAPGLDCNLPGRWLEDLPERGEETIEANDRPATPIDASDEQEQLQALNKDLAGAESSAAKKQGAKQQISEAVDALGELVKQEDFNLWVESLHSIDDFHLLRLQLLNSTLLAEQIPSSMLGVQEANRLYRTRERLRFTVTEFVSILRMLINDHLSYIPGWYWFKDIGAGHVEALILDLAFFDSYSSVRQRAFDLLSSANVPLPEGAEERTSKIITSHPSASVRRAAVSYAGKVGGQTYLPIVCSALGDDERAVSYQAKVSKYLLQARKDPDNALSELLDEKSVEVEDILNELRARVGKVAEATLLKALDHPKDEVRLFAIEALIQSNKLTIERANLYKEDKYDPIKAAAYRFLIEQGAKIEAEDFIYKLPSDYFGRHLSRNLIVRPSPHIERDQIVLEFYRRYRVDELMEMANDWGKWAGQGAYRALALEHFSEFAEKLRDDLRTDFAAAAGRFYELQLEEWRNIIAETDPDILLRLTNIHKPSESDDRRRESNIKRDVEWRKIYYIAAALAGLARHGSPADVKFGRQYLNHSDEDVRIEAVRVIKRCGNKSDVPRLVEIAKSSSGLLQELAAQAALALSSYQHEVASEFLTTDNEILLSVAVSELIAHGSKEKTGDFLKPYLYDPDEKVRTRVMAFFIFRYEHQELENWQAQYMDAVEKLYYFDVVCCFDRILYAPPRLKSFYRKTVEDKFFGLLTV